MALTGNESTGTRLVQMGLSQKAQGFKYVSEVPNDMAEDVGELLFLLQAADQLASDGYRDPRLIPEPGVF